MQYTTDTLILTATQRLAQAIRHADESQRAQHHSVWETPQIMPLLNWLQVLWNRYSPEDVRILSDHQEQALWFQLLNTARQENHPLLHVANTVPLIQQAWQLLNHWLVPLAQLQQSATHSAEVQLFIHCTTQFSDYCRKQGWLSQAELPQRLLSVLAQAQLPAQIRIAGFDELPPAYQQFLDALRTFTTITALQTEHQPASCYQQTFADSESEITAMAAWAKHQIEINPQQKCGCIVPQLTQYRDHIVHIFKRVLPASASFNISVGQRLPEFSMIATGLQVLALQPEKLAIESLGELLQSPYLCQNETDSHCGAMLDAACRRLGDFELNLAQLYAAIAQWQTQYPEHTGLKRWRAWAAGYAAAVNLFQFPSQWADHFARQLTAIGWPGGRSLNSLEYQLLTRWRQLLAELAELDVITGAVDHEAAYACLQRLAAQTIFQPQTATDNPLQILGVVESNGFDFDALWIMGLADHQWPASPQPNPFLPYALQVQLQMPHASPQQELRYAQLLTKRLFTSTKMLWLSCSAADTEQTVQFSCIVQPQLTRAIPANWDNTEMMTPAKTILASARQEYYDDQQGPAILSTEKIRGGSAILTQQAECPFRAFATFRLNAVALAEPEIGVSPLLHGILVHHTLDKIWQVLQNQQRLLAISAVEQDQLIEQAVDAALQEIVTARKMSCHPMSSQRRLGSKIAVQSLDPSLRWDDISADATDGSLSAFIQIEKKRLFALMQDWLALEKQRPPFTVVAQETEYQLELAGLKLHLKIDRIDRLSDGSQLLIDYKTGLTQLQAWLDERLQQPQLPLYTLIADQPFSGVAFAQLSIGKLAFKGLHTEDLETAALFPAGMIRIDDYSDYDVPKTWQALLVYWHKTLEQLAADFQRGYAAIDPVSQGAPCQTCDLQTLCRVSLKS